MALELHTAFIPNLNILRRQLHGLDEPEIKRAALMSCRQRRQQQQPRANSETERAGPGLRICGSSRSPCRAAALAVPHPGLQQGSLSSPPQQTHAWDPFSCSSTSVTRVPWEAAPQRAGLPEDNLKRGTGISISVHLCAIMPWKVKVCWDERQMCSLR